MEDGDQVTKPDNRAREVGASSVRSVASEHRGDADGRLLPLVDADAATPAAEWIATDQLVPWDDNPRKNSGEPVSRVAKSIKRFGFGAPILARRANREIIAGHTRWMAAKQLKLLRVPVRLLDLNEREAHLLALADNRINELTKWSDDLGDILSGYDFEDAAVAGFDVASMGKLMGGGDEPVVSELDASDLEDRFWLTVEGPIRVQPEVLRQLRDALAQVEGVSVELRHVEER